jgi:hypothetical protein
MCSNNPSTDSCALATAPATAAVAFSALPASALDASGKLTTATVGVLRAALQSAVTKTACSSCTVAIQRVLETGSGKVLFEAAARRLQTAGGVTVSFTTIGGSTAQLAAVVAASSTTAFTATATASVVLQPGFSGVTASAVAPMPSVSPTASAEPLLGLLGLLGLLVALPLAYVFCRKAKAPAPLTSVAKAAPSGSSV